MQLRTFINKAHRLIEARESGKKISQADMAKRLSISSRTYENYWRGVNEPKSMSVLLNMLSQLEDEDVLKMIRLWKKD